MAVNYYWNVEQVVTESNETYEEGEIVDHWRYDKAKDAIRFIAESQPEEGQQKRLSLVREIWDKNECEMETRSWAYVDEEGQLPNVFLDADGRWDADMPKRLSDEFNKAKNCK